MGWICGYCGQFNEDESRDTCEVCDHPRSNDRMVARDDAHAEEHDGVIDTESIPFISITEDDDPISYDMRRRAKRAKTINKLLAVFVILVAFIFGQAIEYYSYITRSYVYILTELLRGTSNYEFNTFVFLIITSVIGGVSLFLHIYLVCKLSSNRKYVHLWLIAIVYALQMIINPAIGAIVEFCFSIFLSLFINKRALKVLAIIASIISAVGLTAILIVAEIIPAVWIIKIDYQSGADDVEEIRIIEGEAMPTIQVPERVGYTFVGIYDEPEGGNQYYDEEMRTVKDWDGDENTTLYVQWSANTYTITFDKRGGILGTNRVEAIYDSMMPDAEPPVRTGYTFEGYYDSIYGGEQYYNASMQGIGHWDIAEDITLYAHWSANTYSITFDKQGGTGGTDSVLATFDMAMPNADAPLRDGYTFLGYFDDINDGTQYYDSSMQSMINWDQPSDTTLYAQWAVNSYIVTFDKQSGTGGTDSVVATYDMEMPDAEAPVRTGYSFEGYFDSVVGGTRYYDSSMQSLVNWNKTADSVLYAHWSANTYSITLDLQGGTGGTSRVTATYGQRMPSAIMPEKAGCASGSVTIRVTDNVTNATDTCSVRYTTTGGCVATGTLITLSDGSQVPVEKLTGDEMLLVWNMYTGDFDSAPILFIDQDDYKEYEVINLKFSDGTEVKVITEHAFWDFNLNEYVFLDKNASQYVGHWFNKQTGTGNNLAWTKVQLIDVEICQEYSIAWSPVTYGHLCYYVNGMLSMPGNTEGLINIFDVNSEQLAYDTDQMRDDIELYGLYTYEEFNSIMPVSEILFNAFNGQYLKVAIGKGIIDWERIKDLISRYDIG